MSYESAGGIKKKMVVAKSCYRYQDVSCNNKNICRRIIYVFVAFFSSCREIKAEERKNLLQQGFSQKLFFNFLVHLVEIDKFLSNCIYCASVVVVDFSYFCIRKKKRSALQFVFTSFQLQQDKTSVPNLIFFYLLFIQNTRLFINRNFLNTFQINSPSTAQLLIEIIEKLRRSLNSFETINTSELFKSL